MQDTKIAELIEIQTEPIEILKVQPHNYALAKESLDYISERTEPRDRSFNEDPVVHIVKHSKRFYFCEDGDHRLFNFFKKGNKYYDCTRIYDISNLDGKLALAQFRREKNKKSILGENPRHNLIEEFEKQFPTASASDININQIYRMTEFVQSLGITNVSHLEGKLKPTLQHLNNEFKILYNEFLQMKKI